MTDTCPNCGFHVELSPRERRFLTDKIDELYTNGKALVKYNTKRFDNEKRLTKELNQAELIHNDNWCTIDTLQGEVELLRKVYVAAKKLCPEVDGVPVYHTSDTHWLAERNLRRVIEEIDEL